MHTIQNPYTTFIQQANTTGKSKIRLKKGLALIEVIKGVTYIWIGLGFSLYSLTKLRGQREEGTEKHIKLQTGK